MISESAAGRLAGQNTMIMTIHHFFLRLTFMISESVAGRLAGQNTMIMTIHHFFLKTHIRDQWVCGRETNRSIPIPNFNLFNSYIAECGLSGSNMQAHNLKIWTVVWRQALDPALFPFSRTASGKEYAVKVRRHSPWSRVRCHGCRFTHCQFHSRRHSLRITLKYTTLVPVLIGANAQ